MCFYTISLMKEYRNKHDTEKAKEIFLNIIEDEKKNKLPIEIFENGKKQFLERYEKIDWHEYHKLTPFNESSLALYTWSPIADELKILDKKIVLNSMILKWDNIKKEFQKLIDF